MKYTDADVELVASTFVAEAKKNPVDPATPPWMGTQTRLLLGPTEHDIARAVLDALAAAGRLASDDARTAAARLLRMEREHTGTGREGHLSETDLRPLLHALGIDTEEGP